MEASGVCSAAFDDSANVRSGPTPWADPTNLDINSLGDCECILKFDTEITNGTVHLGMPEQKLHRAEVTGLLVDLSNLRSSHRMGAVGTWLETD